MTRVGIAIVENADCFLVGVRAAGQVLAGHDEFPGGKCQQGESPRDCAVRECREETGLDVAPLCEIMMCRHTYDHGSVELHFWHCEPIGADHLPANGFEWVNRKDLPDRRFPAANQPVIESLTGADREIAQD